MAAKKSSMTPKIIIGVVVLLVIGAAAYFFLMKGKSSMMNGANPISSVKDMLSASVSMHCEYNEGGRNAKVDIKNGAVREDYSGATPEETGSIIIKDKKMWMWNGKEGYVYDIPDDPTEADSKDSTSNGGSQKDDLMKSLAQYKDACHAGVVSDTLFDAPADVTFTDMAKMMQQGAGDSAAQQQYQQQMMKQMQQQPQGSDNSGDSAPSSDY